MKISSVVDIESFNFFFAIAFAYCYYVFVLGGEPLPIPTISKTWTFKPSNFLSRFVIVSGSLVLIVVHFAIYEKTKEYKYSSILLLMAVVASLSLAVVGAVCADNSSPECLSSNLLHVEFAIVYFVLIDAWMIGMESTVGKSASKIRILVLLISLASKTRYALSLQGLNLSYFSLGAFEWANVASILIFMRSFVLEFLPDMKIGVLSNQNGPREVQTNTKVFLSFSNASITILSLGLAICTMGLAYLIAETRGDFEPFPHIPQISDLFVLPPGNSIARLFGVWGCTLLAIIFSQFYFAYSRWTWFPFGAFFISMLSTVFLSFSLCISKVEDNSMHFFCVSGFFALLQIFAIWISFITETGKELPSTKIWMSLPCTISMIAKSRFLIYTLEQFAILELIDVLSMIFFIGAFAWFQFESLESKPFALFETTRSQTVICDLVEKLVDSETPAEV